MLQVFAQLLNEMLMR